MLMLRVQLLPGRVDGLLSSLHLVLNLLFRHSLSLVVGSDFFLLIRPECVDVLLSALRRTLNDRVIRGGLIRGSVISHRL
jgi:hypothetical protein